MGMSLCSSTPAVSVMSYQPNMNLIASGTPNSLVPSPPFSPTPAVQESQVGFPANTSAFYDASMYLNYALPIPYALPVQARHNAVVNVVWADGHASLVHAQASNAPTQSRLDNAGNVALWTVTSSGPYQGNQDLQGIPYQQANGSWALNTTL